MAWKGSLFGSGEVPDAEGEERLLKLGHESAQRIEDCMVEAKKCVAEGDWIGYYTMVGLTKEMMEHLNVLAMMSAKIHMDPSTNKDEVEARERQRWERMTEMFRKRAEEQGLLEDEET